MLFLVLDICVIYDETGPTVTLKGVYDGAELHSDDRTLRPGINFGNISTTKSAFSSEADEAEGC